MKYWVCKSWHGMTPGVITTNILAWVDLRKTHGPSCMLLLALPWFGQTPTVG